MRPYRSQKVESSVLVVREAQGRSLFQDFNMRSIGQRTGYTLTTVAVFPMVCGPWVIQRCQANSARCDGDGVEPFVFAFFLAMLLRSWPIAAGLRTAMRREATPALAPLEMACSRSGISCSPGVRNPASCTGHQRPAPVASRVV